MGCSLQKCVGINSIVSIFSLAVVCLTLIVLTIDLKIIHTLKNLQLKVAGLSKYVRSFSERQTLKGYVRSFSENQSLKG